MNVMSGQQNRKVKSGNSIKIMGFGQDIGRSSLEKKVKSGQEIGRLDTKLEGQVWTKYRSVKSGYKK